MKYAQKTSVASEKSRMEIERTLMKYGASGFAYAWQGNQAVLGFEMNSRRIRFTVPMPDKNLREFTHTPGRDSERDPKSALASWEQATRQRWRALALIIKAKLEAVESQITSFEEEFLNYIVLPTGQSVGQWLIPQIESAYHNKRLPPLLPGA